MACDTPLKSSWWGLQHCFRPHCNAGLHVKLCSCKVARVRVVGISGLPFGSPGTKNHLDEGLVERCRVLYYIKEGGGFPRVWAVVRVLWVRGCPWLILTPKVFQQNTNQLVGWSCVGSCGWIVCLSFFLVPSRSSSTPLYPSKCLELGNMPRLFALQLFTLYIHIWVYQGAWERVNNVRP